MSKKDRNQRFHKMTVELTSELRDRLKVIAEKRYRVPNNLSHAIRLLIEDEWGRLGGQVQDKQTGIVEVAQ